MTKRPIFFSDDEEEFLNHPVTKKKKTIAPIVVSSIVKKKIIKYEELPQIKSLDDLIRISETKKYYKNINMDMIWSITSHLKELQQMIGMKSVKDTIFHQVLYYIQGLHLRNVEGDYLHTIITGKPGVGKTTLSKIISKIYQNLGILSGNKFRIVSREDVIGEFLGSTAIKTKKVLNSCLGGVLFFDELYSIGPGQKDKDSFSKEAIDTINLFLSEHKNDFCFIGAGYKEEIDKCFFSVNPGLKRRFQWIHNIDDYEVTDLVEIFIKKVKDSKWNIDQELQKNNISNIFNKNKENLSDSGGSIENLLSKIKICHSIRIFGLDTKNKFIINETDITEAFKLLQKCNFDKKQKITYDYFT